MLSLVTFVQTNGHWEPKTKELIMSDTNTTRHTAATMQEFFMRLAEAIRQGKSDAQVLKRFIVEAVTNRVFIPYFRDGDGKFTKDDRKTLLGPNENPVPVPFNTKDSFQGWTESAELYYATWEAYCDLNLTYESEEFTKQIALREVKSIIKTATAFAAKELGIKGSKTLEVTSVKMDAALTAEDIVGKLVGIYAKDGDYEKLLKVALLIETAASKAEDAEAEVSEEAVTA